MQPPLPDDVAERLDALADLADACRAAYLEMSAQTHWRPAPGSPAARVQRNILDPADNSDGILGGFDLVSEVVATYLEVAAGHFGGLVALLRGRETMFAHLPVIRSILEHTAHTVWVIGGPDGTPSEMLARAYLEEFVSCEYAKLAAERMDSPSSGYHRQRWKAVRRRAIAAFPDTTPADLDEDGGRTLSGQTFPKPEAAVQQMFDLTHKAGGTATSRQGLGIYVFLCSATHPSMYQARQLRVAVDHGDHVGTVLTMDVKALENALAVGVVTFYNALGYTSEFLGADAAPFDALGDKIAVVLPTALR